MPGNHLSEPLSLSERSLSIENEDNEDMDRVDYRQNNGVHHLVHDSLIGIDAGNGIHRDGMSLDRNANQIDRPKKIEGYHYRSSGTCVQIHPDDVFVHSSSDCDCKDEPCRRRSFPKERRKTFIAFALLAGGFVCNSYSIFLTHQKIPDRTLHPPLPDLALDNITKRRWLNDLADIIVIICIMGSSVLVISHRHRWILARRVFFMLSLLYVMRSVTMYVTVLPLANDHVYCSPKLNSTTFGETFLAATTEVIKLLAAGGLGFMGKKTLCGDYIFSGHTIIFMMAYLLVSEYTPKKHLTLRWIVWVTSWAGIIGLLISHGHYTIDVIIGYFATTRLFWIYHALANKSENKRRSHNNHFSEVWWFPVFQYLEGNVDGKLPHEYSMPRVWKKSRLGSYAYKTLHMVN